MSLEQKHLDETIELIRQNVGDYEEKVKRSQKETEELYAAVSSGEVELYNQLIVSQDIQEHNERQLKKNKAALIKPYFGRIDYRELDISQEECLYIGKNGVSKNKTEVHIIDWRAPVSTLYYENELGRGSYEVPDVGEIAVDLKLKRTFDINEGKLLGFYDNDTAATDELLVKYLSQNKDVILGDIISTIQKEQNEIIRQTPFRNLIVQGMAGSGKTTVAMHRISYILYNYEKRFTPDEFCIIGSNDMLLNYITSGLPELDVHNVGQKRMDVFFIDILGKEWKKKYQIISLDPIDAYKSKMVFITKLEEYLENIRRKLLFGISVEDPQIGVILSEESLKNTLAENQNSSILQLYKLLNERIRTRIKFLVSEDNGDFCKEKLKEYRGYFKQEAAQKNIVNLYTEFLCEYQKNDQVDVTQNLEHVKKGLFDVYDAAALALIQKRITEKQIHDEYGQMIIDEAQDFGPMIYYVLKQILTGCYFTIMGDVSQNINYEIGMNDWDDLKNKVFDPQWSRFHVLAKSYRNTIEISEYAGKILEKASFGQYKIEPVIRHGREVCIHQTNETGLAEKTAQLIKEIEGRGYHTIAVICHTEEAAEQAKEELAKWTPVEDNQTSNFQQGVMVLPIHLTKGLEFDGVILWDPNSTAYAETTKDAKLLYVAVTRALHELHIVYTKNLSKIFQ